MTLPSRTPIDKIAGVCGLLGAIELCRPQLQYVTACVIDPIRHAILSTGTVLVICVVYTTVHPLRVLPTAPDSILIHWGVVRLVLSSSPIYWRAIDAAACPSLVVSTSGPTLSSSLRPTSPVDVVAALALACLDRLLFKFVDERENLMDTYLTWIVLIKHFEYLLVLMNVKVELILLLGGLLLLLVHLLQEGRL